MRVQERSRLQRGWSEMREYLDARYLCAGCTGMLLSGIDLALCFGAALFFWHMCL